MGAVCYVRYVAPNFAMAGGNKVVLGLKKSLPISILMISFLPLSLSQRLALSVNLISMGIYDLSGG